MKRIVLVSLVAVVFVACQDRILPTDPGFEAANFEISDGAHDGNGDVFFLPPLVPNPSGDPEFGDRDANPDLEGGIFSRICEVDGSACFDDLPMTFQEDDGFYRVNWRTRGLGLPNGTTRRITIVLGSGETALALAFRDVRLVKKAKGSCQSGDTCDFNNGSTQPIKVRIETGAACIALGGDPDNCATAFVKVGEEVELPGVATAKLTKKAGIVAMKPCTDLHTRATADVGRVDLRTFGPCVEIIPFDPDLSGVATLCDAFTGAELAELSEKQINRMTVHRHSKNKPFAFALAHGEGPDCVPPAPAQALEPNRLERFVRFARNTWRAISDRVVAWIEPAPLYARTVIRCNRDTCSTDDGPFRSSYQVAQPASMAHDPSVPDGNFGDVLVGTNKIVKVNAFDSGELVSPPAPSPLGDPDPVEGVRLTFTATGGSISTPVPAECESGTTCTVETDEFGNAEVTLSVVLDANTVVVSGIGVGTDGLNGTILNVFAPSINDPEGDDPAVQLGVGTLEFTATGIQPDLIVETLTHSPTSPTNVDLITFTATVKNVGTAVAPASTLEFLVAGEATGASGTLFAVPAIAAGSDFDVLRDTILPPGSYGNTATADFVGNAVVESDETNNTTADAYTVLTAPVLIYGPSLLNETTFRPDNERTFAIDEGFTVVVKNAADWALLTEDEFKAFSAIVIGDRGGLGVLTTAEANRAVWSAAITGPVVISTLNPAVHQCNLVVTNCRAAFPQPAGTIVHQPEAVTLIRNAINFAAGGAGTGAYISLGARFAGAAANTPLTFLSEIGAFQVAGIVAPDLTPPPNFFNVFSDIIDIVAMTPTHPAMASLTNAGLSGWFASNHEFIQVFPTPSYTALAESDRNFGTFETPVLQTLAVIIACSPDETTDCVVPSESAPASFDVTAGLSSNVSKVKVPKNIR